MVQRRIKPHQQQVEESARRPAQRRLFASNQIFGLVAAVVVIQCTVLHPNPAGIFPRGW